MNLEDRNLQIKKLKKESRKLKLLGVEGLFLSSKQTRISPDQIKLELMREFWFVLVGSRF